MAGSDQLRMSPEEFRLLRDLVYEFCGIFFQDDVRYLLEKRLAARVRARGLLSFDDYYQLVRFSKDRGEELEQIVELLTTNETYFFREAYQLRAFSEEILPELIERRSRNRHLRLWSAGCSTGEEAYTIAMLVRENRELRDWDVEIFANDISRKVVQQARRGLYGKSSFRAIDAYYLQKYFTPQGDRWQVRDDLKELISFGQLNLLDDEMLALLSPVDVIFCRNVLIYFNQSARLRVVKTFYEKLVSGGYLLLGHSESLLNISTDFELVHLRNDMVYRKPLPGGGTGVVP